MIQVLVVEDEVVIRNALKRLLERHKYQVSEAGTVTESLEKYDLDKFDVIISDLRYLELLAPILSKPPKPLSL